MERAANLRKLLTAAMMVLAVAGPRAIAVATIDLREDASTSGSANGAYFEWVNLNSTGTGAIDVFLRIQGNGLEEGYNTNGTLEFDTKKSHTKAIQLGAVPLVEKNGALYREFLLDIQESTNGTSRFLSLDKVEIYLADTGTLTGYPALGTKVFDLDIGADGDTTVLLDSSLNPGNGWGDVLMYVPISGNAAKFVYLYSKFGGTYASGAGPEEWAVRVGVTPPSPPTVPAPAALLLTFGGSGLVALLNRRKSL